MHQWLIPCMFCAVVLPIQVASGQVVQLPSVGTFQLSTSVAVPDSGSAALGSVQGNRTGATSRGPLGGASARGSSIGTGTASMHATVIDLSELDAMIRSQAGKTPSKPKLGMFEPRQPTRLATAPRAKRVSPEYDYLMALSHYGQVVADQDTEGVSYFLTLADRAKNDGNWTAVEMYYRRAWNLLPESRRQAALQELGKAREAGRQSVRDITHQSQPR